MTEVFLYNTSFFLISQLNALKVFKIKGGLI